MASVRFLRKALADLERLDLWREEELELPPVGPALVILIDQYFAKVDLDEFRPGAPVEVAGEPTGLLLIHVRIKRSQPFKVFYRPVPGENLAEIRRVRHPRQKEIK